MLTRAAALATIRTVRAVVEASELALQAEKDRLAAEEQATATSGAADETRTTHDIAEAEFAANAVEAGKLYEEADALLSQYQTGILSEARFTAEVDAIQARLIEISWDMWTPQAPPKPPTEAPPAAPGAVDLTTLEELMKQQGALSSLTYDPVTVNKLKDLFNGSLTTAGFSEDLADQARSSPVDPEKAAAASKALAAGILGASLLGGSAVIAAEAIGLGQLETPASIFMFLMGITGLDGLGTELGLLPFKSSIIQPAEQYYASISRPSIPGTGDLIRFLVREAIPQDRFNELMARQGFSDELSANFWTAHWREIGENRINEAYHRGVIDRDERDKYLIILDYRPDARPGFSIGDRDIIGSLSKRLIPRVDVRRGWEYGLITDAELEARYVDLGYEDDAPMMAEIQKEASLAGEKSAVARAAGRAYRETIIPEDRFLEVLAGLGYPNQVQALWVLRYQWESIAGTGFTPDELAEARIAEAAKAAEVAGEEEPE